MKKALQAFLQRILGFERYLYVFSRFKIATLKWDGQDREGDFFQFLSLLDAKMVVLDIGANIGIMTALIARTCPDGKVFAFEPVPENVRTLNKVVNHFGYSHVKVHPIALGPDHGEVQMAMPVLQGVKMQGLTHVQHQEIEGYEADAVGYKVPQLPLDEVEDWREMKVGAIKMDVENYEQFVLQGALTLLDRDKPLIYCELWDNENRQKCFELLEGIGYQIKVVQDGKLVRFIPETHPNHNFFFFPVG